MLQREVIDANSVSPLIATSTVQGDVAVEDVLVGNVMVQGIMTENKDISSILDEVNVTKLEEDDQDFDDNADGVSNFNMEGNGRKHLILLTGNLCLKF